MTDVESTRPTKRFTDRVAAYVQSRPSYPPELFNFLRDELRLRPADTVIDLGAGTGILSALFLDRGHRVLAVEPNAAMRAAAEEAHGTNPNFRSVDGTAEHSGLPSSVADFVVAGQAFHWFDPDRTALEVRRVLNNDGWAVMVWNQRRTSGSSFLEAYEGLLGTWGTDYATVNALHADPVSLGLFFGKGGYEQRSFPYVHVLDAEGLRARVESSSYMPGGGHPKHQAMMEAVDDLHKKHATGGSVRFEYDTLAYWGRP